MKPLSPLLHGLPLIAGVASARRHIHNRRQGGLVDPSTAKDCTFFDTAVDETMKCAYFEETWAVSHQDFVKWNPSVNEDCSGIKVANSYCVEVPPQRTTATTKSTTTSTTTAGPTVTTPAAPSPTQAGLIETCNKFYLAQAGDTCDKIVQKHGTFTFVDFLKWNPAIGTDCLGLWATYYYCVGVLGTPTATTSTTTRPNNGVVTPTPTQPGIIGNCNKFYLVKRGDSCGKIAADHGITVDQFAAWNLQVGRDCTGLLADAYACLAIIGDVDPGTPTNPTNGIETPSPTQPDIIPVCRRFHLVKPGQSCAKIAADNGITLANFVAWNPKANEDCSGLWANAYACVATIGLYDFRNGNMAGWDVKEGAFDAKSKALVASRSDGAKTFINARYYDVIYEGEIKLDSSSGNAGLIFRVTDVGSGADNYRGYYAGISAEGFVVLGRANKNWSELQNARIKINAGQTYRVRVQASGDLLSVFVDDMNQPKISLRDGVHRFGRCGARVYGTGATFDNIRIWPLVFDDFAQNMVGWSIHDGTFDAASKALVASNVVSGKATLDTKFTNFVLDADLSIPVGGSGNAGFIFRATNLGKGPDAYRGYYAGIGTDGTVSLGRVDNSWTEIGNAKTDIKAGQVYRIMVQALGDSLHVFVGDMWQPKISAKDGSFGSGMIGARVYRSGATYDNFSIQSV